MTTIACDGASMAADGQRECSGTILASDAPKVRKLDDGSLLGASGSVQFALEFERWLSDGGEKPDPEIDPDFTALVLNPNGEAFIYGNRCIAMPIQLPAAIGSGMDFAIGAMDAGVPPSEAVRIAAKRDPHTGGEIRIIVLGIELEAVA